MARVFNAKYFPMTDFSKAAPVAGMSYTSCSILAGKEVLAAGVRFQIGSGSTIPLWNDPWLPLPYTF